MLTFSLVYGIIIHGLLVKGLRRRPLTAETGVRFPYKLLIIFYILVVEKSCRMAALFCFSCKWNRGMGQNIHANTSLSSSALRRLFASASGKIEHVVLSCLQHLRYARASVYAPIVRVVCSVPSRLLHRRKVDV